MIGNRKRIEELEDQIQRLDENNRLLTREKYQLLDKNTAMGFELDQLRKEQRHVVSSEDVDLLHKELDQAQRTIDELRIDLQHQNECQTEKIKALRIELSEVTRHRDNAKQAFRRVSSKRKKNEAQNA